jgi:hypothetical protein
MSGSSILECVQTDVPQCLASNRHGWKTALVVVVVYSLAIMVATYPRMIYLQGSLPGSQVDPLNHICIMKWNKSCLLEGKSQVYNPGLQHPVGFPVGLNPSMLLQSGLFIPLSLLGVDDYLCYNILWFVAFLFSGCSIFVLGWTMLRDRFAAGFAGLVGMISTPMMMRAHGHLELMFAGSMALFLAAWVAWLDRPGRRRLLLAVASYLLVALSAAYFAVLTIVPAVMYVAWRWIAEFRRNGWTGSTRWLVGRLGGFAAFLLMAIPGLMVAFSSQFWAKAHGFDMERPLTVFTRYYTPLSAYLIPTPRHLASAVFPVNFHSMRGLPEIECAAYLGVVPLFLIAYAAISRASFRHAAFWWVILVTLVVLAMGAYLEVGTGKITLPALWLRQSVPFFKSLRAPSRFNILACILAGLIAAAGFQKLMTCLRRPWQKGLIGSILVVLVIADMSLRPFFLDSRQHAIPGCYGWIKSKSEQAALLEIPLVSSGCPNLLTETCAYWQTTHGLKTSAGYSAMVNNDFDDLVVGHSPFSAEALFRPDALDHPESLTIGVLPEISLREYAWLMARRARFDYMVLHAWEESVGVKSPAFWKLAESFQDIQVRMDPYVLVYDLSRLPTPTRPVLLCDQGLRCWRGEPGPPSRVMGRAGDLFVYVPEGRGPLIYRMKARAFRRPRTLILKSGHQELARWKLGTSDYQMLESPPLVLPGGFQTLKLESDGEDQAANLSERPCEWDDRPYGVQILEIRLQPSVVQADKGPSRLPQ